MCSLHEHEMRNAVHIQWTFIKQSDGNVICAEPPKICTQNICVSKNHHYESEALKADSMYQSLLKFSQCLDSSVSNSREVVRFWMIHCTFFNFARSRVLPSALDHRIH